MKKDNLFIYSILIILLFANIINYYLFSTAFLVELVSLFLFIYGYFFQKNKFKRIIYLQLFFIFYLTFVFTIAILQSNGIIGNLGKETLRSFSILLLFIPLFLINTSNEKVFKFILLICKLSLLYTLYELIYINIISPGNFQGLVFGSAILNFFSDNKDTSPYLLPQMEFIIPFIRPFGLFFQPQKSTFIYSIALIIIYILNNDFAKTNPKINEKWYYAFIIGSVLAGGKTALLCNLLLLTIIKIKSFGHTFTYKQFFGLLLIIFSFVPFLYLSIKYMNSSDGTALALNKDYFAYTKLPFKDVLFGTGFIESKQLEMLGFSGESFIFRILTQVGTINFIFINLFIFIVFKNINLRVSLLIICIMFFMTIHYAVINVYFYLFVLSYILMYEKRKSYNYNN